MRDRGELFFQKTERAQLLDQIEALRAENEQLKGEAPAEGSPPMPLLPPNVAVLRPAPETAPAATPLAGANAPKPVAHAPPAPPPPPQRPVDLRPGFSTSEPKPWDAWLDN